GGSVPRTPPRPSLRPRLRRGDASRRRRRLAGVGGSQRRLVAFEMPPHVVHRTYLELTAPAQLRRSDAPTEHAEIVEVRPCPVELFRRLYRAVGERHHWRDRFALSDDALEAYLARSNVRVFVLRARQHEGGFFELVRHDDASVEIAYFGLMESAQGRGFGKWLLVRAAEEAWAWNASRVWLHTCTLDSPAALPNYLARGFVPFRTEEYTADLPDAPDA
ncbi:MAG: GNAT family N-acetyltransferase, partial [Gemmatimonadaceae bacterium]